MRTSIKLTFIALAVLVVAPLTTIAQPPKPNPAPAKKAPPPSTTQDATLRDITQTLGFVPSFMRALPAVMLPGAWQLLKEVQMNPNTKLDGKTKELIGLAVAAQIPCEYCIEFHTEVARANGATDEEIQEAVAMAAITREMSTALNGMRVDKAQFSQDVARIVEKTRRQAKR